MLIKYDIVLKGDDVINNNKIHDQWLECYSIWKETDAIYSELARRSGLSDSAYWILYSAYVMQGECTQKSICDQWAMSKQTVNSALKDLEKKGIITLELAEADRRSKYVVLTDYGMEFVSEKIGIIFHVEKRTMQRMSDEERTAMIESSRRYLELFQEEVASLRNDTK